MLFIARIFSVHLFPQCCKAARQQRCMRCLHLYRKHFCYSALSQTQQKKSDSAFCCYYNPQCRNRNEYDCSIVFYNYMSWISYTQRRSNFQWVACLIFLSLFCLQITPGVFIFPAFINFSVYFPSVLWGLVSYFKTFNCINLSCFAELRAGIGMDVVIKVRSPIITFLKYLEIHKTFWTSQDNISLLNSSA